VTPSPDGPHFVVKPLQFSGFPEAIILIAVKIISGHKGSDVMLARRIGVDNELGILTGTQLRQALDVAIFLPAPGSGIDKDMQRGSIKINSALAGKNFLRILSFLFGFVFLRRFGVSLGKYQRDGEKQGNR